MSSAVAQYRRPADTADVARRIQRRLSAFALVMDVVTRDVETVQSYVLAIASGFDLTVEQRHELDRIALRLFDAQECLNE